MKRNIVIVLLSLVLISVVFAGGESESPADEMVVLRVWDRVAVMDEVVQKFNEKMEKEGRNVRAEFELIPYEQQVPKFMAAMTAGKAPDIYSLDLVLYPYFNSIGAFRDITDRYEALPFKNELPPKILELGMYEGAVYALPYEIDLSVMLWNKNMFADAGLDPEEPPKTWQEMIEVARKLTKDTDGDRTVDQWGFAEVGNDAGSYMFWFMPFVWSNGGAMFGDDGSVVLDSPETVEALQLWYDLIHTYEVAPKSSAQWSAGDRYNAFVAKKLGLFLGGNFYITSIMKDAPDLDFGVTFMPRGKDDFYTFGGGNLIGITQQSKHPEEAWEFMEFAFSREVLVECYAPKMMLVPRKDLYDNKYYAEVPQMKVFAEMLDHTKTQYTTKHNQIYNPVLYYLQGALLDRIDVKEAVYECAAEIRKLTE
ncbi:ABC transporter substrate-binding protein [Marispirochaeta aestuarii]|uniref:ABC transporter substrate-binding protein n=1 Tax=Marispirochaeta aestuarii TaxID=1963862 RepID=UPI0029C69069|nr:ABC transporter substrate-binding protein [Marispirochaeta aestuarii]